MNWGKDIVRYIKTIMFKPKTAVEKVRFLLAIPSSFISDEDIKAILKLSSAKSVRGRVMYAVKKIRMMMGEED